MPMKWAKKKLGGHRVCLGDTVMCKVSLKWALFAHFPSGAWGEFYKSWL